MDVLHQDIHDELYIGLEVSTQDPQIFYESAYQYSTLHVLDSVLESGNLHATSVEFLNDTGEYHFVADQIGDGKDYKFFSISFTRKKDDVPQYMIYAGEIGIGIEYDFSEKIIPSDKEKCGKFPFSDCCLSYEVIPYERLNQNISSENKDENNIRGGLKKCKRPITVHYYKEESAINLVEGLFPSVDKTINSYDRKKLDDWQKTQLRLYYTCFFKNAAFESEEEVRIAFGATGSGNADIPPEMLPVIHFLRHSNKLLRPYMEIFYCTINKFGEKERVGWPIKSIWIGPGRDQQRAFTSVKMRLEAGKVKIFPLPLHIFTERLVNFVSEALDYFEGLARYDDLIHKNDSKNKLFDNKNATLTDIFSLEPNSEPENILLKDKNKKVIHTIPLTENEKWRCLGLKEDNDIRHEAKKIIQFTKERMYAVIESKIHELLPEMLEESKIQWAKNIVSRWSKKFENSYYFSSWGIAVYKSRQTLSLN